MTYISPNYTLESFSQWTLHEKIIVFADRINGWQLEVADRCINGWSDNGQEHVQAIHNGQLINHIPNAGFATLQILLSYFDMIGFYKCGIYDHKSIQNTSRIRLINSGDRFLAGFYDVFPNLQHKEEVGEIFWQKIRSGLYHTGVEDNNDILYSGDLQSTITFIQSTNKLGINPHKLVKELQVHFRNYIEELKVNQELQKNFELALELKKKF